MAKHEFLLIVAAALFTCGKCSTSTTPTTSTTTTRIAETTLPADKSLLLTTTRQTERDKATTTSTNTTAGQQRMTSTERVQGLMTTSVVPRNTASPIEANALERKFASYVPLHHIQSNSSVLSYYNYPFHQYALPECATQQVCNAVYTRLDRINALCACPQKFGDPCSISFASDDAHTIELVTDNSGKALTLIKTCEPIGSVRQCRGSKDWSLLALQNVRTGKSHYLVICRCVESGVLEGPISHENPPYAKIPGIRVYGMICIREYWDRGQDRRRSRSPRNAWKKKFVQRHNLPKVPWQLIQDFVKSTKWN